MSVHDPLQESANAERHYVETKTALEAREEALRKEYQRIQESDPSAELKERVAQWIAGEARAARQSLKAAVNGPDFEERLREIVPPGICALFPSEVEQAIVSQIVPDHAGKAEKLAELKAQIDDVAAKLVALWEQNRALTDPMRGV